MGDRFEEKMQLLDSYSIGEKGKVSARQLRSFEKRLGADLPLDYRAFLEHYGAIGFGKGARFRCGEACPMGEWGTLDQMYGLTGEEGLVNLAFETYAGRIPDSTIPIGTDPGGNLILLGVGRSEGGRIWFWDHEHRGIHDRLHFIRKIVRDSGADTSALDDHALIGRWKRLSPEQARTFDNLYPIAETFSKFVDALEPHPTYGQG